VTSDQVSVFAWRDATQAAGFKPLPDCADPRPRPPADLRCIAVVDRYTLEMGYISRSQVADAAPYVAAVRAALDP
jgi:hypothetical protein